LKKEAVQEWPKVYYSAVVCEIADHLKKMR